MHKTYDYEANPHLMTAPVAESTTGEASAGEASPRRSRLGAEPTICAPFTRAVLAELRERGVSVAPLLAEFGLDEATVADPEARIPLNRHLPLFARAVRLADDPLFPLAVGRRLPASTFHAAALAAEFADDLGDAYELFARYWLLVSEGFDLAVDRGGDGDALVITVTDARIQLPQASLLALCGYLLGFAQRTSGHAARLRCISLPFPAPPRSGELGAALGSPLTTFDASHLRIDFEGDGLATPLLHPNAGLRAELEELALRALNRAAPSVVVARTRASIARLRGYGSTSIDEVAKDLGMSSRTLQRHLKFAAATFSGLRDAVCGDIARDLLRDRSRTVDDVGAELGFSSRSAFHRAFLRWTGKTPAEYRSAT